MPIHFDPDRWAQIRRDANAWWKGDLDRPLIQIRLTGADPERPEPELPSVARTACYGDDVPVDAIVDRWEYDLSSRRYLGDAFPAVHPDFGPGVLAAFLGARTRVDDATVWFEPPADADPDTLDVSLHIGHPWFTRIATLVDRALDRFAGRAQIGMTDLGGALDVLSTFRPGDRLPLDLYDRPDWVKRTAFRIHDHWWSAFDALNDVLFPRNPGYTAWTPIFSSDSYYMLQCDFSYMIGPDMFREFALPELAAACERLANPFYHLDGSGQLPHLDALLSLDRLKGIQWVPGAGAPAPMNWLEVYARIREAGKLAQVLGGFEDFDEIASTLGSARGLVYIGAVDIRHKTDAESFLARHGVPCYPESV